MTLVLVDLPNFLWGPEVPFLPCRPYHLLPPLLPSNHDFPFLLCGPWDPFDLCLLSVLWGRVLPLFPEVLEVQVILEDRFHPRSVPNK